MMPDRAQFRDAGHYMIAVASEIARPALRLYARGSARSAPSSPTSWRRGVILSASHIGDVLYRTCSLPQLHAGLPQCAWTYVTSTAGAEILRGNPDVAAIEVVADDDAGLVEQLRAGEFDAALCTDNIQHHVPLLAAVRAWIPNRVAFGSKGLTGLATHPVRVARAAWPAQIRTMVAAITEQAPTWPLRPRVFPGANDRAAAAAAWNALPANGASMTIAVSVTTRQRIGIFPLDLFTDVLRRAVDMEPELRLVLAGSAADRSALETIGAQLSAPCAVLAGEVGLRAFVALLEQCDAFLGSDSGPRHMANAAGIPVHFVRNMAVPEIEAGRYCETEVDLAPPGEYLDAARNASALRGIDRTAAAAALVADARAHAARRGRALG